MVEWLTASLFLFLVLVGWMGVQQAYARFARRHPELGPFRAPDGGCGGGCGSQNACSRPCAATGSPPTQQVSEHNL